MSITVKQELEFTAEIPYHEEGDKIELQIERRQYEDSPIITLETYQGRVSITLDEARQLVRLGEMFERAENVLKGLPIEGEGA